MAEVVEKNTLHILDELIEIRSDSPKSWKTILSLGIQ